MSSCLTYIRQQREHEGFFSRGGYFQDITWLTAD